MPDRRTIQALQTPRAFRESFDVHSSRTNVALRPRPGSGEGARRTPPKELVMINLRVITVTAALPPPRASHLAPPLAGAARAGTPAASAKGGDGVKVRGTCTQNSTAKLKLSREDSGTEIE